MAFPDTALPVIVEIAPGADPAGDPGTWTWVDITSYVRLRDGIEITQGRGDESARVQPSRCVLRLDNRDGRFSPRNPLGQWYGQLGRNTPLRVRVDPGSGPVNRFSGFVSSWPPRWDKSGRDASVPIEANGVLRRLSQGSPPAPSPVRRAFMKSGPAAYWPCEDGGDAAQVASALTGHPPAMLAGVVQMAQVEYRTPGGNYQFGTGPLPDFSQGGSLSATVPAGAVGNQWTVHAVATIKAGSLPVSFDVLDVRTDGGSPYQRYILRYFVNTGGALQWEFVGVATDAGASSETVLHTVLMGLGDVSGSLFISARQNGGNIDFTVNTEGAPHSFSIAGTLAAIRQIDVNSRATTAAAPLPVGHIAAWATYTPALPTYPATTDTYGELIFTWGFSPWSGEAAHLRLARLCDEEGIPFTCPAVPAEFATRMGPQPAATFLNLVEECADADQGVVYESGFGLGYLPRQHRYNRPVSLALDRAKGHLADPPEPVDDDQQLRNRVTVKRSGGSSAIAEDTASISRYGLYDEEVTVNHADDTQLEDHASWRLHLGTVDELRWPAITVDLAAAPELIDQWLTCGVGSRVTVDNPPDQVLGETIDLIVEGYTERLGYKDWDVTLNCSPASPWMVGVWDDPVLGRWDTAGSELAAPVSAAATSLSVATTTGPVWTTDPADLPFDINVGGERMTVTAISGTSSPQTFTVTRAVNGISKSHAAGTPVRLAQPMVWAL